MNGTCPTLETPMLSVDEVESLNKRCATASPETILDWIWERFGDRAAIGTSFQGTGLVLLHMAHRLGLAFPAFTIDTGLLFPETLALKKRLEELLGRTIESLTPDQSVEQQEQLHGPELWRRDPDLCCTLRKVLPLRDRLDGLDAWVTGLRRDQGSSRAAISTVEVYRFDDDRGRDIVKVNPLSHWRREEVWDYIRRHKIPHNPLHDRGYRSIGCQPCTACTANQGNERAGRWTGFNKTECGIHTALKRTH